MVEHRSAVSVGLRFESSWGLRIFSLSHARDKTNKNLSLHFDFFPVSQNKQVIFYSYYIKLILLVRSRQLDISIVPFFCVFLNFDLSQSIKTQKRKKKKKKKKNSANIQPSGPHAWSIHIYIKSESKVNQKALGASSFMLWLKFALISWTR